MTNPDAWNGKCRPMPVEITHFPASVEIPGVQDTMVFVIPRKCFGKQDSIRNWRTTFNRFQLEEKSEDSYAIIFRTIWEYFGKMIQNGWIGELAEVENPKYTKWLTTYGDRAVEAEDAPEAPAEEPEEEAEDEDGAAGGKRKAANKAPPAKKARAPPAPPPATIPEKSLTHLDKEDGKVKEKVRVFAQLLVKKKYDLPLDLYSDGNIVAYAFWFRASDGSYNFQTAAEEQAKLTVERLKAMFANIAKGHKPNYTNDVRDITYHVKDESKLRGYDRVVNAAGFRDIISNAYADIMGVPRTTDHFSIEPFSQAAFYKYCDENGVCEEQKASGVDEGTRVFKLPIPQCTVELTMEQADPKNLAMYTWPWSNEMHRYVLRKTHADHEMKSIGYHDNARDGAALNSVVERYGICDNQPRTRVPYANPYPFELTRERYGQPLIKVSDMRLKYIRIYDHYKALCAREIGDEPVRALYELTVYRGGAEVTQFGLMADHLEQMAQNSRGNASDMRQLAGLIRENDVSYRRLMRIIEEDYRSWMQTGNTELPESMQSLFLWAEANDGQIDVEAPTIMSQMSPFANMILRSVVAISSGFQIAGMLGTIFHAMVGSLDIMNDEPELKTNEYLYGDPGTGKSLILEVMEVMMPTGTTSRESGGGSTRASIFTDATNRLKLCHEAPSYMTASRNSKDADQHLRQVIELEGLTSGSIRYLQTKSSTDPVTGRTDYAAETVYGRAAPVTMIASNENIKDPATRSRFSLIEVRKSSQHQMDGIRARSNANLAEARVAREAVCTQFGWVHVINMFVRKLIGSGGLPLPSTFLFELQISRAIELMDGMCIREATEIRKFQLNRNMYVNAVIMDAIYKAFFSEVSPVRRAAMSDDGTVRWSKLNWDSDLVKAVLPYFVDNEEIVIFVANMRFNELVSKFRYNVYRLLFTKMLLGASFDESQLAAWVRYAAYMERIMTTQTSRDVKKLSFIKYDPTDLRATYCCGGEIVYGGVDDAERVLAMRPVPLSLQDPTMTPPTPPPQKPAPAATHPSRVEHGRAATGASKQYAPTNLEIITGSDRFTFVGTPYSWQQNVHPDLYAYVPAEPAGMMLGDNFTLFPLPDGQLDPNYIRLNTDSYANLVSSLTREINSDSSIGTVGNEASVKAAMDELKKVTIRTHPLKPVAQPYDASAKKARQFYKEEWAYMFLPDNLQKEAKLMPTMIFVPREPGKKTEDIYVNVAILGINDSRLRHQFLRLFSHPHTRERWISLGSTPNCTVEPMEAYYLRKSQGALITAANPAYNGNKLTKDVLSRVIGQQRAIRDGVSVDSSLGRMLASVGSTESKITIDEDIERFCSRDFRRLHDIGEGSLPEDFERQVRAFYESRADSQSRRVAEYSYANAVKTALKEAQLTYMTPTHPAYAGTYEVPLSATPARRAGASPTSTPIRGSENVPGYGTTVALRQSNRYANDF
jgi:hypothetical protein